MIICNDKNSVDEHIKYFMQKYARYVRGNELFYELEQV